METEGVLSPRIAGAVSERMKVAMFGHKRVPSREGGVEIVVEELSTRMAAQGHQVSCYNRRGHHVSGAQFDTEKTGTYKDVRIRSVWTVDRKGLAALTSSLSAAVRTAFSDADVVHIHAEGPAFMCWLPKLFGKRVVVTIHGLDWQRGKWRHGFASKYIHAGERMAVRCADEIIVLSRNVQNYFRETYGRETVWIPNGVSGPRNGGAEDALVELGLEKDGYILFLGRLVPEKGIHYLIEAFRNIKTDKLLVIAGGSSGTDDYIRQLKEQAKGDDRIVFTGFVQGKTLEALYGNAYVYVLPSDVEGMPLSLLEAMSYGNCCLVSSIPECTEVVENNAAVFETGNVDALRESLQALCDDPDRVNRYRQNAGDFICEKYNWDDVAKKTLELYHESFADQQVSAS
jgi:glycosyltransferase involved in cell wall biosynthesis